MQLGNILAGASQPIIYRSVKFRVLVSGPGLQQKSATAEAVLCFVDEEARHEADRQALLYLRGKYAEQPIPPEELEDEQYYRFLSAALRDKDNPVAAFCPVEDLCKLRSALIAKQISWLLKEYRRFVQDEYPELASPEQQQALVDQARP